MLLTYQTDTTKVDPVLKRPLFIHGEPITNPEPSDTIEQSPVAGHAAIQHTKHNPDLVKKLVEFLGKNEPR